MTEVEKVIKKAQKEMGNKGPLSMKYEEALIEASEIDNRVMQAEKKLEEMLIKDNHRIRKAGNLLAEASLRVIGEYDGLHRLAMAVSDWCRAIASEGGREERHQSLEAEIEKKEATILALKNVIAQSSDGKFEGDLGVATIKGSD